ncbi:MAG: DUF4446 family protein [Candidatus Amesbacteria bacterium]|nr:DUF4446 family protein [Candidatus Amesbacteria bacterium]
MSWFWLVLIFVNIFWLVSLTVLLIYLSKQKSKIISAVNLPVFGWSLVRFNPFSEVGGHHSFVLTLLDMHKNGVVLTGLHGRGLTRFYTKPVSGGLPDQPLSDEETKGLKEALQKLK